MNRAKADPILSCPDEESPACPITRYLVERRGVLSMPIVLGLPALFESIQRDPVEASLASVPGVARAALLGGGELPGLAAVVPIACGASAEEKSHVRMQVQAAIDHAGGHAKPTSHVGCLVITRVTSAPKRGWSSAT